MNLDASTIYVFVRGDLPEEDQLIQAAHAVSKIMALTTCDLGDWKIVALNGGHSEKAFSRTLQKIREKHVTHAVYRDSDHPEWGETALATPPLTKEQSLPLANYRLRRYSPVAQEESAGKSVMNGCAGDVGAEPAGRAILGRDSSEKEQSVSNRQVAGRRFNSCSRLQFYSMRITKRGLLVMKQLAMFILVMALLLCLPCPAQTSDSQPANLYAAGVSYNNGASPSIAGTGLYARKVADAGTYAFTVVDALPISKRPFTVNTNFSGGVAQKVLTIGKVSFFVPTSAGVSYSGTHTGWAWSTGAIAIVPLQNNIKIMPNVRLVKSSVSQDSGYQLIAGLLIGWGK